MKKTIQEMLRLIREDREARDVFMLAIGGAIGLLAQGLVVFGIIR